VIATVKQSETLAAAKAAPQVKELAAAVRAGATGEIKVAGGMTATVRQAGDALVVTTQPARGELRASWCTYAVTGAIWGLGAAVITAAVAIALLTPGVDVITLAGITLSVAEWGAIAAVAGSFSAIYNLVAAWVC
jgi:hypothetical protein